MQILTLPGLGLGLYISNQLPGDACLVQQATL